MATLTSPTLVKLLTNVRNLLNQPNPSNSFWTDLELTEYLNEAVRIYFAEVIQNNEGHFVTQTDLDITANSELVTLPNDFYEIRALYKKVNDGYNVLPYQQQITQNYSTQGGSSADLFLPSYYFRDNTLVLRPVPNFSETDGLRIEYIRFPDTMVNGGDTLTSVISPIFKNLIEMYAVYKAKLKQSMVNGTNMHAVPAENLSALYQLFKDAIRNRSKYPQFIIPFNPEGEN